MKRFFCFAVAFLAAAMSFTSCLKDDAKYPKRLEGDWLRVEAGTGYTYLLSIEELAGGQYAYFRVIPPVKVVETAVEGTLHYDNETGTGYIESSVVGGMAVTLQAYRDESDNCGLLNVTCTTVEQGKEYSVTKVLTAVDSEGYSVLPIGKWKGSATVGTAQVGAVLDVTSIVPVGGKCGTLELSMQPLSAICDVVSISALIFSDPEIGTGIMTVKKGNVKELVVFEYNTITKVITLFSEGGNFILSPSVPE